MTALVDRRALLIAAGACLPAAAFAGVDGDARLDRELDAFADAILRLAPEQATSLGVDVGARAGLRSRLGDLSAAGEADWAALAASMRARLAAIAPATLSAMGRVRRDTVLFTAEQAGEGHEFAYGAGAAAAFVGRASPYAISQQTSALSSVPAFLDAEHPIGSPADAEAYLARVAGLARQLDQETARIASDAALGVVPPAFIAAKVIAQREAFLKTPAAAQRMATSVARRAQAAQVSGNWRDRCVGLLETEVYPAVVRQLAAFRTATAGATSVAGVQRLPHGQRWYGWSLGLCTTTRTSALEMHRIGLEQNEAIKARMDALLKAQGLSQGTVGARTQALNTDPRFVFPDTDAGRAALIAYLENCLARIRPLLSKVSHLGLRAEVRVARVPPDIEDGAPLGYMSFASLDGSRPSVYYVNLKSTALWPKYQLPSLTAHEGLPGHAWQGAYLAERAARAPLIASLIGFTAYTEGWGLYAEQLADEAGLYDDDPFGRIGYLQAQQFRACRLVADTGLHALGWTRDQTVRFLTEETGRGMEAMVSETDRYCVYPGQACGFKMGHNEILRLRERARAALGERFDLAAFDDAIVETGGVPLSVLANVIEDHIRSVGARRRP